jgi:membrane peptidoglycan carboxypeptidase
MARALFGQSAGGPEAFAAQNLVTPAFLDSHQPMALQTQIKRRMAADQLELEFSEEELVHEYFERAYYGNGEYGLDVASRSMFGKDPVDLTEDEAFALAAVTRAPALRSNPERLALWVTKQKEQIK